MGIEYDLRKVQLTELEVLLEFERICEKYKLPYFLIGGSTLVQYATEVLFPGMKT